MNKESVVLLSKDILMAKYLPVYGNTFWKTPNIDELAAKGTVFRRHYTAAPSTGMAFTAMCTGKFSYMMEGRRRYVHVEKSSSPDFLFEQMEKNGFDCHILWNNNYLQMALPYSNCFSNATIHTEDINQFVGPHNKSKGNIVRNEDTARDTLGKIFGVIDKVSSSDNKVFLWIHLPHVLKGRICYGDDMDLFDEIVGYLRKNFSDENIFITADHGNMNGSHGIFGYGFHVYESAIRIPLIAPRIEGMNEVTWPTSNVQLKDIILNRKVEHKDYVISDTAYVAQPKRKIAIVHGNYKLIYNKEAKSFELYDVVYDPEESLNLLMIGQNDKERSRIVMTDQVYFYPYYYKIDEEFEYLKNEFLRIWKTGTKYEDFINYLKKINEKRLGFFQKIRVKKELRNLNSRVFKNS